MNIKNISKQIHVVMTRQLYNSIAVKLNKRNGFLQAFETLNHIVDVINDSVKRLIKDFIKTVFLTKEIPSDLAEAKTSKILTIVKQSLERGR